MNNAIDVYMGDGERKLGYASTEHSTSSYGLPVVLVDGEPYGSFDLALNQMRLVVSDEETRAALERAGYTVYAGVTPTPEA